MTDDQALLHDKKMIREEAALSIRDLVEEFPEICSEALGLLSSLYHQYNKVGEISIYFSVAFCKLESMF